MDEAFLTPLDETPFDEVVKALLDQDQVLDPLYLYRLSDLGQDDLADLRKIWEEIHVERRRALIEDLEELTDNNNLLSFEQVFRLALVDQDPEVRFFTTRAIEVFDTDDLVPHFLEVLDDEESDDVRAVTASVLGKYIYRGELDKLSGKIKKKIENKLFAILDSEEADEIRRRALEAVSFSSRKEVKGHILSAYESDLEDWLASALFAMGRSLDTEFGELVQDQLGNTSPKVRLEAVRACGELVLEDSLPSIIDLLDDLPDIRQAAILTLSQIGGEDAGQAIQGLMDGEVNEDEADLIQGALERLDFQEEGLDLAMFNLDLQDRDNYILDDYDIEQDGLGDDLEDEYDDYGYSDDYGGGFDDDEPDFDLDSFDLDDDYWME